MQSVGIVRRIDDLGRVVIPKEMRNTHGINEGDPMAIFVEGNSIILRKYETSCIFCGGDENLMPYESKMICGECTSRIAGMSPATLDKKPA